jgi:hypothetical protein
VSSRRTSSISIDKEASSVDAFSEVQVSIPPESSVIEKSSAELPSPGITSTIQADSIETPMTRARSSHDEVATSDIESSEPIEPEIEPTSVAVAAAGAITPLTSRLSHPTKERSSPKVRLQTVGSSGDEAYYPPSTRKSKTETPSVISTNTSRQRHRSGSSGAGSALDTSAASQSSISSSQNTPNTPALSHADDKKMVCLKFIYFCGVDFFSIRLGLYLLAGTNVFRIFL